MEMVGKRVGGGSPGQEAQGRTETLARLSETAFPGLKLS